MRNVTRADLWLLYISHFLSMWNPRVYEYAIVSSYSYDLLLSTTTLIIQVLFIQAAFPIHFRASSMNGTVETACVLIFSSPIGRLIDRSESHLWTLLFAILANRIAVFICCLMVSATRLRRRGS